MTARFDWEDVADAEVVPEQAAIAVYTNPSGRIVVRQAAHDGPDDDSWIIIAPEYAGMVAASILRAAGLEPDEPPGDPAGTSPTKDRAPAERQRNGDGRDVTGSERSTDKNSTE